MLPSSKRKLYEQIVIGSGLVLALVKCYANWRVRNRHYTVLDLVLSLFTVGLIITGLVTALLFLIFQIEQKLRKQLLREGQKHQWQIRPAADCGLLLLPLFPLALLIGLLNYWSESSHTYAVVTVISQGFLFTSMAYLWRSSDTASNSLHVLGSVAAISSIKVALVLWHLRLIGLAASITAAFGSQILFLLLLYTLLLKCPRTFTIGEALMVSQATIALVVASFFWLLAKTLHLCGQTKTCHLGAVTTQLTFVLSLSVASLILLSFVFKYLQEPIPFYGISGLVCFLFIYPTWFWILKREPLQWLFAITFHHSLQRSLLIVHWLACAVLSVAIVAWANLRGIRITTTIRKLFHGAVILKNF